MGENEICDWRKSTGCAILFHESCESTLDFLELHEPLVFLHLFESGEALPRSRKVLLLAEDSALEVLLAQVEPAEVELALDKVADLGVARINLDGKEYVTDTSSFMSSLLLSLDHESLIQEWVPAADTNFQI